MTNAPTHKEKYKKQRDNTQKSNQLWLYNDGGTAKDGQFE